MGKVRSDSPICQRIVLAFIDFIQSVEPATGVDIEGLDVARECLEEAFKLSRSSTDYRIPPGLLVDLFSSSGEINDLSFNQTSNAVPLNASNAFPPPSSAYPQVPAASEGEELSDDLLTEGVSKDELFGQFYTALDKINFFMSTPDGEEDHVQLAKATRFFEEALLDMDKSGSQTISCVSLAETFKSQGNQNMKSKLYAEAIDLYTCAIALSDMNAIYYCNRAAAYTLICKYAEAIADCRKSIEIDPNYAKAYSRQGLVYYALGKYKEAVVAFLKALQLDPNNESVQENIRVARQKLREEQRRSEPELQNSGSGHNHSQDRQQNPTGSGNRATGFQIPINLSNIAQAVTNMAGAGSSHSQERDSQSAGSGSQGWPFASMQNDSSVPIDFSQILGMVSGALGQQSHARTPNVSTDESSETNVQVDSGLNVNLENLPQELSGVFGSVVDMLTSQNPQQEGQRRS